MVPEKASPRLVGILLTVFLDLLGFGMFIPDLQIRGEQLAAKSLGVAADKASTDQSIGFYVGLLLAGYSLAQLFGAPILGQLSDRKGRRPVLLITSGLSILAYILYAHADNYWISFGSRVLSGLAAANLGVAFAYVADITLPKDRARGIGMVGAALGVGFILGPVFGGQLVKFSGDRPEALGYVGAFLALVNFAYIFFFLPESLVPGAEIRKSNFWKDLKISFASPGLPLLLGIFFVFNLAFAMLQTTFFRLLADPRSIFHFSAVDAKERGSWVLGVVGLTGALVQGVLLPKLQGKASEVSLLRIGLILLIPSLALVPYARWWDAVLIVVVFQGLGSGLAQPSLNSLVSRTAPKELQGGVFGVTQALGALARFVGPIVATPLFQLAPAWPYLLGGALLVPLVFATFMYLRVPKADPTAATG